MTADTVLCYPCLADEDDPKRVAAVTTRPMGRWELHVPVCRDCLNKHDAAAERQYYARQEA